MPAADVDHRCVQRFGELHQALHAFLRPRGTVGQNHRVFRCDEELGRFGYRTAVALRRDREGELGNTELFLVAHRFFRQVSVRGDEHRPHGHRSGDLIGAHDRFGEMLERHRLVVPLGKVAYQCRRDPARSGTTQCQGDACWRRGNCRRT